MEIGDVEIGDVEPLLAEMREGFVHADLSTKRVPKLDLAVSTTRLSSVMTRTTTASLKSPKSTVNG